uniref:Uncharacterized protein n=1 Tax=Arundo donax TaxID=35708 RepID=A0A0A8XXY4_ARUDO
MNNLRDQGRAINDNKATECYQ